ncbi:ATP-binding protein [Ureibacillus chungkukjangi]|uniref:ATP-binding protein n=1 Tax=Ureibacillus chungkukjangi TaxID=1202712 RepID=UPI000D337B89|nr:ATP-binding protein [Ureibacillus chungkukjangi]
MQSEVLVLENLTIDEPLTLPREIKNEFKRDSVINSIKSNLNEKNKMVVLLGDKFTGKTTILKQFYQEYNFHTAVYFVQGDRYKDRIDFIFSDICKQLLRMCSLKVRNKIDMQDLDDLNTERILDVFSKIYHDLCSQAKRDKKIFYIIFDGLDKLQEDVANEILNLLPPGDSNGVFLILSINSKSNLEINYDYIPLNVFNFSLAETQYILQENVYDTKLIGDIHKFCNGLPAYINDLSIKISEDPDLVHSEFFTSLPENYSKYIESLWSQLLNKGDNFEIDVLSVLLYAPEKINLNECAHAFNVEPYEILNAIKNNEFIRNKSDEIFIPQIYTDFLKTKLSHRKTYATQFLIKLYENQSLTDSKTVTFLSELYVENNNYSKLRELMSLKTINLNLEQLNETITIRKNLDLLSKMSFYEEDWATYQKSILTGGILLEIKQTPPALESEIKILCTLRKFEEAIKLTYMCSLEDDRAFLLSIICRALAKNGESIPLSITEDINNFVDKTSISSDLSEELIDKLVIISTNIFSADMQLALDMIRKIVEKSSVDISKEKLMDYMLLKLFLKLGDESAENSGIEEITASIDDSELKDIINVATTTNVEDFSIVLEKLDLINDPSAKMFYLINWCINHETHKQLFDAVEYTLEIFTNNVDHSLTLRDLRFLVETLEKRSDYEKINELIIKIEKVKESLNFGLKKEYIKLELAIAKLESSINPELGQNRFLDLLIFIDSINELDIKCLGLIYLIQDVKTIMKEDYEDYYDEVKQKFNSQFNKLLLESADHYAVSQDIFFELAKVEFELAMIFFNKINTEKNRFRIFQQILKARIETTQFSIDLIPLTFRLFSDKGYKDYLIFRLVHLLADNNYLLNGQELLRLKSSIMQIKSLQSKIISYSFLFKLSYEINDISIDIYDRIKQHLADLGLYENKKKIAYYTIQNISKKDSDLANEIYNLIKNEEQQRSLLDDRLDTIHVHLISLLIKMLPEVKKNSEFQFYIKTICSNVARCNSILKQVSLYNELGLKLIEINHNHYLDDFISKYIEIFNISEDNFSILSEILKDSGTLLYLKNENYYFELLEKLDYREIKENCILNTITYLATQKPVGELIDLENLGLIFNLERAKRIVNLIKLLKVDANVSVALKIFVQVLENSIVRREYSIREIEALNFYKDILRYLDEILPDSINIQHEGYIILSKSLFSKFRVLKNSTVTRGLPSPEELYENAKSIINISDRIFVYCYIANYTFKENLQLAESILDNAQEELVKISNYVDKIERSELIADSYLKIGNKNAAQHIINKIFDMIKIQNSNNINSSNNFDNIIELAYQINPEFAQSLSKNLDSPHETIEVKRTLQAMNYFTTPSKIKESSKKISKNALKSFYVKTLKALNAGRGHIQTEHLVMETIGKMGILDLELVFLGLDWYIENSTRSTTMHSKTSALNNQFYLVQEVIDFIFGLDTFVIKNSDSNPTVRKLYSLFNNDFSDNFVPGEGQKAKSYIINWINEYARESLMIYDPYFSYNEMDMFLQIHLKENITVICSHTEIDRVSLKQMYKDAWTNISDQSPPFINFAILTSKDGVTPMHDRYIIGDRIGLQLTTSFNGLNKKDYKISELTEEEVNDIKNNVIFRTLNAPPKIHNNLPISTHRFYLE